MRKVHPKKLLHSKWTAVDIKYKQKHFIVVDTEFDDNQNLVSCTIQAVINRQDIPIDWRELNDTAKWKQGWQ